MLFSTRLSLISWDLMVSWHGPQIAKYLNFILWAWGSKAILDVEVCTPNETYGRIGQRHRSWGYRQHPYHWPITQESRVVPLTWYVYVFLVRTGWHWHTEIKKNLEVSVHFYWKCTNSRTLSPFMTPSHQTCDWWHVNAYWGRPEAAGGHNAVVRV